MTENNEFHENNNLNEDSYHQADFYQYYDDEENTISPYQFDRRKKQAQLKRQVRKSKNNICLFLFFARITLILLLCCSIIFIFKLKYWRLNPKAFNSLGNSSIKIENNQIVSSNKILHAIQQNEVPTCPIFLLNTDELKKSILEISPIQNVYIKRFWFPARLEFLIQEKEPAIVLAPNENVDPIAFYTKDGTLIGRSYLPLNNSFKTIKVLTYGYNSSFKFDKTKIDFLTTLAKDIENYSKEPVLYIDIRKPDDIYVQIPTVKIKLGAISPESYPDTLKKIAGLPSILPKVKMLEQNVKYVDLRWQNNLYYIKLADTHNNKPKEINKN